MEFFVEGRPVPWQRARHGRGNHFNTPEMKTWKQAIQWAARSQMVGLPVDPTNLFALTVVTYRGKPGYRGTSNRITGDVDNYAKAVMDALQGVVYEDDIQVSEIYAYKKRTVTQEGISVVVEPIDEVRDDRE